MPKRPTLIALHPHSASQVERAYRSIKAGIIDGRYSPGTPLSEPSLAAVYGMSRTPIREGLSRLRTPAPWPDRIGLPDVPGLRPQGERGGNARQGIR